MNLFEIMDYSSEYFIEKYFWHILCSLKKQKINMEIVRLYINKLNNLTLRSKIDNL